MNEPRTLRKRTDFSIERILSKDTCNSPAKNDEKSEKKDCPSVARENAQNFVWTDKKVATVGVASSDSELSWLQCTRYRPPKLPRKSSTSTGKNAKRRLGSHPRIPFTKFQLQLLEERYRINPYLSRRDVIQLSGVLHLPQSRVKIWFQNRRARERKESQSQDYPT